MSITTLSGFVLKSAMHNYPPIAAFQPLINDEDSVAARILMGISIPGNLIFMNTIFMFDCGFANTIPFTVTFLLVSLTQIVLLLYLCQLLVRVMWRLRIDPDSSAIPLLTAAGDLLGGIFLIGCFWVAANVYGMKVGLEFFPSRQFGVH
ncbi:hypothetical protein OESDEN_10300 [Oesophagostomum dentatum]|uniref:SLC41A/MgtE integral membrane domain-containing protein n=1 Tax=Oesophagostomum dentatum TaxID=61180 RepID=A0A0B1T380_OESDE|nr:hypothetical protein OESDEN_10300 [Oesophagostomum dentatum]